MPYRNRAIAYVRSNPFTEPAEEFSPSGQETQCRIAAQAHGLELVESFIDSFVPPMGGPGWANVLSGIRSKVAGAIVVWHPDRLVDRPADLLRLSAVAISTGVQVVSATHGRLRLDWTSSAIAETLHENDPYSRGVWEKLVRSSQNPSQNGGFVPRFRFRTRHSDQGELSGTPTATPMVGDS